MMSLFGSYLEETSNYLLMLCLVAYVDDLKDKLCEINDVARTKLLKVVTGKRKPVT